MICIYIKSLKTQNAQVKTEAKWPLKETHHTVKTYMNLVHYDINEIKTKTKNEKS